MNFIDRIESMISDLELCANRPEELARLETLREVRKFYDRYADQENVYAYSALVIGKEGEPSTHVMLVPMGTPILEYEPFREIAKRLGPKNYTMNVIGVPKVSRDMNHLLEQLDQL